MVVLFSDLTMHELKVLPRDLQLCTDMATGVDSLGQFQFGDMVQIDPQTVGVIVQIQKENFQVSLSGSGKAWIFCGLIETIIRPLTLLGLRCGLPEFIQQ